MKEKPMLYSGPMVRAILEDLKTQTRRVMKEHPPLPWKVEIHGDSLFVLDGGWKKFCKVPHPVGSRIWVKETWRTVNDPATCIGDALEIDYRADGITRIMDKVGKSRWRPSIHMPRWASRINLEVTEVRVERLQEITNEDALEEGIVDWCPYDRCGGIGYLPQNHTVTEPEVCECSHFDGVEVYKLLWESINGPGSWDQNPWVWVYTFKRIKP